MAEDVKGAEGAEDKKDGDAESGLVAKNRELLGEVKGLKAKLKELGGLDPEVVREALEFKENAERELAEKRGEFEKLRQADREKAEKKAAAKDASIKKLRAALDLHLGDNVLSRAIRDAKGDPKYLLPVARGRIEVVESEDGFETVVRGGDGKASSLDALVKELQAEYPRAFDGTGSSGSGATAGGGGGAPAEITDPWALGKAADEALAKLRVQRAEERRALR